MESSLVTIMIQRLDTMSGSAEDVLLVLEQQAHSAVSEQTSEVPPAPSTSSQHPSTAPVSPVNSLEVPGSRPGSPPSMQGAAPTSSSHPQSTIIPLRGYKRAMVKSMITAGAIPHFHLCDELDMQALMTLRNQVKDDSVLQGVHLTFLPIMIKVRGTHPATIAFEATHLVQTTPQMTAGMWQTLQTIDS